VNEVVLLEKKLSDAQKTADEWRTMCIESTDRMGEVLARCNEWKSIAHGLANALHLAEPFNMGTGEPMKKALDRFHKQALL